nr:retrovirus-related Pol polyprotein from transposon TNT 1-94 [Tanacetum cinerariifolium]
NHVYKLKKALYGLKQASRAWYDMLSSFLLSQDFSKGSVDSTLFIRRHGTELLLARPTEKHVHAVKRIFRYLRGTVHQGLWTMATTIERQVALDEALVPSKQRLRIRRSNFSLPSDIQSKESTLFKLDNKKHIVNLETFRDMLHICHRIPGQSFDELPFE